MTSKIACAALMMLALLILALPPHCHADGKPAVLLAKMTFDRPDSLSAWHEEKGEHDPASDIVLDPTNPHSGASSLRFQVNSDISNERDIFTGVPLSDKVTGTGRSVRVRFYARLGGNKGDVSLRILERGPSGVIGWLGGKADFIKVHDGGEWGEYTTEGKLSDAASGLTVELTIGHAAAGRTVWLDDLTVEELPG